MNADKPPSPEKKFLNSRARKFIKLKIGRFFKQFLPKQVSEVYIRKLHRELWSDASWNLNFIVFTISACAIATFGLISNSTAVIIGAMLIAPLMLPLRAMAFAALEGDFHLFRKGLFSIIGATIIAFLLSNLVGNIVDISEFGTEVSARTQPNLVDLGIAIVAGGISAFAKVRKGVSDAIAGTAIAVALMPPLCVVGLTSSQQQYGFARGAFVLYLTNLLGITLSCMIVFILSGYSEISHALGWTFILTSILVIPLGASFLELVRHARLTTAITNQLLADTSLGEEEFNKSNIQVDWTQKIPIVYITLQTDKDITSQQVANLENSINNSNLDRQFDIVFIINKVIRVTAEE